MPARSADPRTTWLLAAAFVAAAAVFTIWPRIDIAFSALFYRPGEGFPLAGNPVLDWARWIIWRLSEVMVALALVGLAAALARRPLFGVGAAVWGFVLLLYVAVPGILVNGLLKSHWGRARPADIAEFGGSLRFSPALVPSDQCLRNCSFVSGEGAAAVALAVAVIVILGALRHRLSRPLHLGLSAIALGAGLLGSVMRVLTGRHFLSDTVFSALFVLAAALLLSRLLRIGASGGPDPAGR